MGSVYFSLCLAGMDTEDKERKRQTDRQTDRDRERIGGLGQSKCKIG